ncbi:MAG: YbaN family protein [Gammaproteobacteria bacterium]|nr:YbaN family protein [Gammaproteobacteria bacterium]
MKQAKRAAFILFGLLCLGLGALGVFLPLLPTTPFVLLAAFAFANSSDTLHDWLINHNVFGQLIADWRRYGAISRTAKVLSVVSMLAVLVISWLFDLPLWIIAVQAIVLACTAAFVLSRPLPPSP